jgi:hypothetical protein
MPRFPSLALLLALAACDQPREAPVDVAAINARRTDSITKAAAAESAKVAERAYAKAHAPMNVTVSGSQHFSADSGFTVRCVSSESNGEQLLQVEAIRREARISFTIYNPVEREMPVGNVYTRKRKRAHIGNLEVSVGTHSYTDGTGHANVTDPLGRSGSISAGNFIKMGAKKKESHRADLSVRLKWNCE